MKVVFTCNGESLKTSMSERFGRADYFAVVDMNSMEVVYHSATNQSANHGAGIATAQWVIDQGASKLVTNKVGPKAFEVLKAGNIGMYHAKEMTLENAISLFKGNDLKPIISATGK